MPWLEGERGREGGREGEGRREGWREGERGREGWREGERETDAASMRVPAPNTCF